MRIALDRPGMLRMQLRAMLRAAAGRDLRVMLPMVSTVAEYVAARQWLDRELEFARSLRRTPPNSIKLGVMVEVPSLLWQLDEIAERADFLSVGSNDLLQYLYAADRDNKRVAERFDALSAGFLRALRAIVEAGERTGTPVALCGEIGGRPLEAMALIAIGFRHLSMSAASIGPVKAMTLSMDVGAVKTEVDAMLVDGAAASLREPLRALAERQGVRL
jgi:phosphotransferase system, enzyme I, PtsP